VIASRVWPIRISPFLYDLALTVATSVLSIAALLVFARVLAERLGPEAFGVVMLARRIVATVDPVSTFAMVIAVTRFAALTPPGERHRVLLGGTLVALAAGLACGGVAVAAAAPLGRLLYGAVEYAPIVASTGLVIAAYSAFIVLYAWYRGTGRMTQANLWQIWAIAAGPVGVAWLLARPGAEWQVLAGLAAVFAVALVPLSYEVVRAVRVPDGFDWALLRTMVAYGGPRVSGGLAFGALLAVGPVMAPHVASLEAVGYVATGQALLRVVEGATEAFGRVALAKVTQLFAAGEQALLRERIADLSAVVVHVGVFATLQLWLWIPEIVGTWLGPEYLPGVTVVRVVVLAVLPYLSFVTLRSVLDGVEERAVNASNLYVAVIITVIASAALGSLFEAEGLAAAMAIGLIVLGIMTFRAVYRRYRFAIGVLMLPKIVVLNGALFGLAIALRIAARNLEMPPVPTVLVTEVVVASIYAAVLWGLGARWMREIARRVEVGAV
jgi:O-antigen/teichoic acid export membrane protein